MGTIINSPAPSHHQLSSVPGQTQASKMAQQKTKEALKPRSWVRLDPIRIFAGLKLAGHRPSLVRCGFQLSKERSGQVSFILKHAGFSTLHSLLEA